MTVVAPFEQEPTTNFGFDILGYVVEKCATPKFDKAEPIESLCLALVAWMAGPDGKISVEDLALMTGTVNQQALIWNDVHEDFSAEMSSLSSD